MKPQCPACKSKQTAPAGDIHKCLRCGGFFDLEDDGGDYGNNPSARMEREEARRERQQQPRRN